MADRFDADPRLLASMLRGMKLAEILDSYQGATANAGPAFFSVNQASGGGAPGDASVMTRMRMGADLPVADGVSVAPMVSGMRDEKGAGQYEAVSPSVGLNVGPLNASVGKSYGKYTEGDFRESGRSVNYGGGVSIPFDGGNASYQASASPGQRVMHSADINAQLMGGNLAAALDSDTTRGSLAAMLRYRRAF